MDSLGARSIRSFLRVWNMRLRPLGRTLIEPLQAICKWSEKHLSELEANRAKANSQLAPVALGR